MKMQSRVLFLAFAVFGFQISFGFAQKLPAEILGLSGTESLFQTPELKAAAAANWEANQCWYLSWNDSLQVWDSVYHNLWSYNAAGLKEGERHSIFVNGQWQLASRATTLYDAFQRPLSTIAESWNGSSWDQEDKTIRTYNVQGNQTSQLMQNWNGISWDTLSYWEFYFSYSGPGPFTQKLVAELDTLTQLMDTLSRSDMIYNGAQELDSRTDYVRLNGGWMASSRSDKYIWHDYSKNLFTNKRKQDWYAPGYWQDFDSTYVTYGQYDSQEVFYYRWNGSSLEKYVWNTITNDSLFNNIETHFRYYFQNAWLPLYSYRHDHIYDANGNTLQKTTLLGDTNNVYTNSQRWIYEYDFVVSKPDGLSGAGVIAYPNPSQNELRIEFNHSGDQNVKVKIFDLQGRKVQEKQVTAGSGRTVLDTEDLPNGTYFYLLDMGDRRETGKFVIQH